MKKLEDNLKIIEKIPLIIDIEKVPLRQRLKGKIKKELWKEAVSNNRKINVYRIIYKSGENKVLGFIVEPKDINKKLPCIICNRGGSRDFGAITEDRLFISMAKFAREGYIVIASNYSGSPGSEGVDDWSCNSLLDILNLQKILKNYKWADTKRVGMYGWSRGATMTYMCLAKVRWIKAAVVGAGSADEVNAPKFRKGWREHQISLYGKSRKEQIKRSAIYWPEKFSKKTPVLIMHGTADWRVNALDSIRLAGKLYLNKVPFCLEIFEGGDHGLTEFGDKRRELALEWFDRFLKRNEKLPNLKLHGK